MKSENNNLKLIFGGIIFLFGLAFAYFSADYMTKSAQLLAHSSLLLIFGGAYILIGAAVARVFSISLGFLFAADVLVLHAMATEYHGIDAFIKVVIVGVMLVGLYAFAWFKLKNQPVAGDASQAPAQIPQQ